MAVDPIRNQYIWNTLSSFSAGVNFATPAVAAFDEVDSAFRSTQQFGFGPQNNPFKLTNVLLLYEYSSNFQEDFYIHWKNRFPYNNISGFPTFSLLNYTVSYSGLTYQHRRFLSLSSILFLKYHMSEFLTAGAVSGYAQVASGIFNRYKLDWFSREIADDGETIYNRPFQTTHAYPYQFPALPVSGNDLPIHSGYQLPNMNLATVPQSGFVNNDPAFGTNSHSLQRLNVIDATGAKLPYSQIQHLIQSAQRNIQYIYDNPITPTQVPGYTYAAHPSWDLDETTLNQVSTNINSPIILASGNHQFRPDPSGALILTGDPAGSGTSVFGFANPLCTAFMGGLSPSHSIGAAGLSGPLSSLVGNYSSRQTVTPFTINASGSLILFSPLTSINSNGNIPFPGLSLTKTLQLMDLTSRPSGWYTFDNVDQRNYSHYTGISGIPTSSGYYYWHALNQINNHYAILRNLWAKQTTGASSGINFHYQYNNCINGETNFSAFINAVGASGIRSNFSNFSTMSGILQINVPPLDCYRGEFVYGILTRTAYLRTEADPDPNSGAPALNVAENIRQISWYLGYNFEHPQKNDIYQVAIHDRFGNSYTLPSGLIHYRVKPFLFLKNNFFSHNVIGTQINNATFTNGNTNPSISVHDLHSSGLIRIIPINRIYSSRAGYNHYYNVLRVELPWSLCKYGGLSRHQLPPGEQVENFVCETIAPQTLTGEFKFYNPSGTPVLTIDDSDLSANAAGPVITDEFTQNNDILRYPSSVLQNRRTRRNYQPALSSVMTNPWSPAVSTLMHNVNNANTWTSGFTYNSNFYVSGIYIQFDLNFDVRHYSWPSPPIPTGEIATIISARDSLVIRVTNSKQEGIFSAPIAPAILPIQNDLFLYISGVTWGNYLSNQFLHPGTGVVPVNTFSTNSYTVTVSGLYTGFTLPQNFSNQFDAALGAYSSGVSLNSAVYDLAADQYNWRGLNLQVITKSFSGITTVGRLYSSSGMNIGISNFVVRPTGVTNRTNFYSRNTYETQDISFDPINFTLENSLNWHSQSGPSTPTSLNICNNYWSSVL